ncbi:MAG: aromatic ring-hydroxylating dioxygenase subunit alpha [Actinomycetota bacterium]|nr:aromatic ring-hydroxylating dioxygenase subunit alpha [Actinomycetota bacterium]
MATSTGGRSPGQTVQEVLREDAIAPPEVLLREYPPEFVDNRELSVDRYLTQEWHDLEVEQVWRRVWQMACRLEELPAIGDHVVYEVATESVIVVRTGEEPHDVRAYVNSCLHRGTQLRTEGGNVQRFRCPFHGFTWDLEGELVHVPNSWDFPDVAPQDFCLPTAKIAFWGGFVFVNFDDDCEPFDSYIEVLDDEFKDFPLEDRWKAAHVEKVMPCNWKLALEAFIESFHIGVTHPQTAAYVADANTQYDIFPGSRHVNRMITLEGTPSPNLGDVPAEETIRKMQRDVPFHGGETIVAHPGDRVRDVLADRAREKLGASARADMSHLSTSETLDAIEYFLFPNLVPWGGQGVPICYRFRPNGNDPHSSIMEIMLLFAKPDEGDPPTPPPTVKLGLEDAWSDTPALGGAGMVVDQDTDNLIRIQRGLQANKKGSVTLAAYQESRIRHFHETLEHYLNLHR